MNALGHTLFDTAVGRCGLAWSEHGISALMLPEADDEATRRRLLRRAGAVPETAPPASGRQASAAIQSLLHGERTDLSNVAVELDGLPDFNLRVYEIARRIPAGETLTYGDIAKRLGDVQLSRAVGQAMGQNPVPIVVPCHRVVAAG